MFAPQDPSTSILSATLPQLVRTGPLPYPTAPDPDSHPVQGPIAATNTRVLTRQLALSSRLHCTLIANPDSLLGEMACCSQGRLQIHRESFWKTMILQVDRSRRVIPVCWTSRASWPRKGLKMPVPFVLRRLICIEKPQQGKSLRHHHGNDEQDHLQRSSKRNRVDQILTPLRKPYNKHTVVQPFRMSKKIE